MRRLPLVVVGLVVVGVVAVGTGASAQGPAGRTITLKELGDGSRFAFIDQAPKSRSERNPVFSFGDQLVFSNPLVNASGAKFGKLYATCTAVTPGGFQRTSVLCQGVYKLPAGQINVQVFTKLTRATIRGSITGGTGAYANARGSFTSVSNDDDDDSDTTINLAG